MVAPVVDDCRLGQHSSPEWKRHLERLKRLGIEQRVGHQYRLGYQRPFEHQHRLGN